MVRFVSRWRCRTEARRAGIESPRAAARGICHRNCDEAPQGWHNRRGTNRDWCFPNVGLWLFRPSGAFLLDWGLLHGLTPAAIELRRFAAQEAHAHFIWMKCYRDSNF